MKSFKLSLKAVAVFAATLLLLFCLLLASAYIPNGAIAENMQSSAEYFKAADAFEKTSERLSGVADNYADSILLNLAWNMGLGSALRAVLDTKYFDGGELGENYGLYATVFEGAEPNVDYTRYPHGSALFVRFFHLFTDVSGMRLCGLIALCLLLVLNLLLLVKRRQYLLSAALGLSFLLIGFWNISLSLEFLPTFLILLLLLPAYLILEKRGDDLVLLLSVLGGTAVAFFDFLTTETVCLLIPLIAITVIRSREMRLGKMKTGLLFLSKNGASFSGAYLSVFLIKWSAASVLTGENKFASALSSVGERVNGEADGIENPLLRAPAALLANLTATFGGSADARINLPLALIGSFLFMGLLLSFAFLFRKKGFDKTACLLLGVLAAIVPLRFMLLSNHSYLHCFFTYRALTSVIFALLCGLILVTEFGKKSADKRPQKSKRGDEK